MTECGKNVMLHMTICRGSNTSDGASLSHLELVLSPSALVNQLEVIMATEQALAEEV